MDSQKTVLQETAFLSIGEGVCTLAMVGIFAVLGRFDLSVLLGAIGGFFVTVGNFFFMAMSASLAADKAQAKDVEGAKKLIKSSQLLRLFAVGGIMGLCAASGKFHILALVLPLLFVRPVLIVREFFRKKE